MQLCKQLCVEIKSDGEKRQEGFWSSPQMLVSITLEMERYKFAFFVIIYLYDFFSHQLGGIVKPNDGDCHLDTKGLYTHSKIQDYPSISQINLKVKQNAINVIFAVTEEQIEVYKQLKEHIEGATSGQLSSDSANVVDLVKEQYQVSSFYNCCVTFII